MTIRLNLNDTSEKIHNPSFLAILNTFSAKIIGHTKRFCLKLIFLICFFETFVFYYESKKNTFGGSINRIYVQTLPFINGAIQKCKVSFCQIFLKAEIRPQLIQEIYYCAIFTLRYLLLL